MVGVLGGGVGVHGPTRRRQCDVSGATRNTLKSLVPLTQL